MRLLLVRHGETLWNAERRLQGQADIALSERGQHQVSLLADWVKPYQPNTVISSDLSRTRETARLLGFQFPRLDPLWREADLGEWTGRGIHELREHEATAYHAWRAGTLTPPKAESFEQLKSRIEQALQSCAVSSGTLLVVTHGGPIRAIMANLLDLQPRNLIPVNPASLTILELNGLAKLQAFNLTPLQGEVDPPD